MCPSVDFFAFISGFGTSSICKLKSFAKSEEFSAIISSDIFFRTALFPSYWDSDDLGVSLCGPAPQVPEALSTLLQSTFCGSSWINSRFIFKFIDPSVILILLLSSPSEYFILAILFFSSKLSICFFFIYLFAETFYLSLCFKSVRSYLLDFFIMPVLKALSDNSNICVISVSLLVECLSRASWGFPASLFVN